MNLKIAFIINGAKPKALAKIEEINEVFSEYEQKVFKTTAKGHGIALATEAVKQGFQIIVAIGGDGTLNEVLNGILQYADTYPDFPLTNVYLGIIPMGSGNDFTRSITATITLPELRKSIEQLHNQCVDLGMATYFDANNQSMKRYFINVADIGIGGAIAEKLSRYNRWMGATLTYQRAIFSTFLGYKPQPVTATIGEDKQTFNIMSFVIANSNYFGSGLGIAPDASLTDGLLDLVILKEIGIIDYIRHLPTLRKCQKIVHTEVSYSNGESVFLESVKPLPIDMDGEFVGYTPVQFQVIPQKINFLIV